MTPFIEVKDRVGNTVLLNPAVIALVKFVGQAAHVCAADGQAIVTVEGEGVAKLRETLLEAT